MTLRIALKRRQGELWKPPCRRAQYRCTSGNATQSNFSLMASVHVLDYPNERTHGRAAKLHSTRNRSGTVHAYGLGFAGNYTKTSDSVRDPGTERQGMAGIFCRCPTVQSRGEETMPTYTRI